MSYEQEIVGLPNLYKAFETGSEFEDEVEGIEDIQNSEKIVKQSRSRKMIKKGSNSKGPYLTGKNGTK